MSKRMSPEVISRGRVPLLGCGAGPGLAGERCVLVRRTARETTEWSGAGPGTEPIAVNSGPDGEFVIGGLSAGAYEVTAVSEGGRSAPAWVSVGVGQRSEAIPLRLRRAAPFRPRARRR
jgi:hypothetical protein